MTEPAPRKAGALTAAATGPGAPVRRRPRALPTVAAALALFAVLFEFLAFQLRSGNDPALGAGTPVAATKAARPTVIDRKIVKRRVVHLPPKPVAPATVVSAPAPTGSVSSSSAPAPVAAPAPVPVAPAPAPAPAPVTSSS